jgi:hypothetical protein
MSPFEKAICQRKVREISRADKRHLRKGGGRSLFFIREQGIQVVDVPHDILFPVEFKLVLP